MAKWTIYHNPKCSKSREALALLQGKDISIQVVEYLNQNLTEADLRSLLSKLSSPASSLVRTKEELFQSLQFDLGSAEEIIKNLVKYPQLLERPIVVKDDRAIVARPVELIIETFFNSQK